MGIHIGLATPADDAHIRGLLRREPVPGRIAISFEREPEFSRGCDTTGENATVLVARDLDTGDLAGVACRSEREVYVNGTPARLAISGCASIALPRRWLVSRGFSLKQLHDRDSLPGYLVAVTVDTGKPRILVRKGALFPAFHPVAATALAFRCGRRGRGVWCGAGHSRRHPRDCPLSKPGSRRQFFPVWTEASYR